MGEEYATKNGAIHGVFLPFLTDQPLPFTKGTDAFESEGAKELSKAFIATIASFMRTGNPNNSGMLPVRWEKWDPEKKYELLFDADREDIRITIKESDETYDKIIRDLERDESIPGENK
ncbi:MAG: carboxylesterase family protein [Phascolarctobacterium sp.]|nr:carboxylesterase family protein [Phascolarctobacterium sp.]